MLVLLTSPTFEFHSFFTGCDQGEILAPLNNDLYDKLTVNGNFHHLCFTESSTQQGLQHRTNRSSCDPVKEYRAKTCNFCPSFKHMMIWEKHVFCARGEFGLTFIQTDAAFKWKSAYRSTEVSTVFSGADHRSWVNVVVIYRSLSTVQETGDGNFLYPTWRAAAGSGDHFSYIESFHHIPTPTRGYLLIEMKTHKYFHRQFNCQIWACVLSHRGAKKYENEFSDHFLTSLHSQKISANTTFTHQQPRFLFSVQGDTMGIVVDGPYVGPASLHLLQLAENDPKTFLTVSPTTCDFVAHLDHKQYHRIREAFSYCLNYSWPWGEHSYNSLFLRGKFHFQLTCLPQDSVQCKKGVQTKQPEVMD